MSVGARLWPIRRLRERLAAGDVLRLRGRFRGRRGLVAFLAVMGPGLIAGIAGNDAGGITTYSVLGAETGLSLLWLFPITIVILAIVFAVIAALFALGELSHYNDTKGDGSLGLGLPVIVVGALMALGGAIAGCARRRR